MSQQIINISTPDDRLGDVLRNGFDKTNQNFTELYNGKVDKRIGQGLSENDFTDADKAKLNGIEAGAKVNVQSDWGETDPLADSFILNKPPSLYSAFGYFHYSDLDTQTTPLNFVASTPLQLINDTLGAFTNEDQAPYGISSVWDKPTNSLDFSKLSVGDAVLFRADLSISTTSVNQNLRLYIKFGIGTPSEYDLLIDSWNEKSVVTFEEFIKDVSFSIDNEDWRDAPAKIYLLSDDDGEVKVNGWYVPIIRKSINVIDFNSDPLKLNKDTTAGVERAYIINADGSQGTKATSELGSGFIQEALATTGTNNLDFDINSFDKITQTGSIDFEGINTSGTKKIEKTFLIQGSENPTHTITFPTSWINLSGVDADSLKMNYIEISLINGTINYSIAKYDIPDVIAPTLLKASFLLESLTTIELLYSEAIDASVPTNTAWYSVAGKTVTAVTILGNKVRVVVNTAFAETDNPLVTFTNQVGGNGIQDASGNKAPDFSQNIGLIVYRFDSFDRANSTTSINSPSDGGSNWVTPFGAVWGINTNKAYCFGANTVTNQANAVYLETGQTNVMLKMKVTFGVSGTSTASFLLNYVDDNNHFLIQFAKEGTALKYVVFKILAGSLVTLVPNTNITTWVSGTEYTFMVKNNNGVMTLYNGTTSLVQLTDTSISGTKHGIRIYSGSGSTGNTDRFNDFGVYYG